MQNLQFIKLPEVMALTGLSRSTIYLYMEKKCFPKSIKIGLRAVAWRKDDVELWIKQKIVQAVR